MYQLVCSGLADQPRGILCLGREIERMHHAAWHVTCHAYILIQLAPAQTGLVPAG
jgi:hypothetical protein